MAWEHWTSSHTRTQCVFSTLRWVFCDSVQSKTKFLWESSKSKFVKRSLAAESSTMKCQYLKNPSIQSLLKSLKLLTEFIQCGIRGHWVEEGRTESVKNTGDPEWQKTFNLKYYFHQKQVEFWYSIIQMSSFFISEKVWCNPRGIGDQIGCPEELKVNFVLILIKPKRFELSFWQQ